MFLFYCSNSSSLTVVDFPRITKYSETDIRRKDVEGQFIKFDLKQKMQGFIHVFTLQWRHDERRYGVWNHQPYTFIQAQIKENIKAPRQWPLWGEFTYDRWIPHTKGQ